MEARVARVPQGEDPGAAPTPEQRQRYADLLTLGKAYHRLRMGRGLE